MKPGDSSRLDKTGQDVTKRMAEFAADGQSIDGVGPAGQKLLGGGHFAHHGFLQTLDIAYNHHQALRLRPDDIWLLITMAFSRHINQDPEKYRNLFVSFAGKQNITICEDKLVPGHGAKNDWIGCNVLGQFSDQIKNYIGEHLHGMLVADFSTTGVLERALSEMVLMDITQAFFEFVVVGRCGIPRIILDGSLEDWRSIRARIESFAEFGLNWWLEDLRYVLDEFVAAKSGEQINVKFWQRIFRGEHQEEEYLQPATVFVSGWVHVFFPYLADDCRNSVRSEPHVARERRENLGYSDAGRACTECGAAGVGALNKGTWMCQQCCRAHDLRRFYTHRVDQESMPTGFRRTPFVWEYMLAPPLQCEFIGGFAGCKLVGPSEVQPQFGFCVLNKGRGNNAQAQWTGFKGRGQGHGFKGRGQASGRETAQWRGFKGRGEGHESDDDDYDGKRQDAEVWSDDDNCGKSKGKGSFYSSFGEEWRH